MGLSLHGRGATGMQCASLREGGALRALGRRPRLSHPLVSRLSSMIQGRQGRSRGGRGLRLPSRHRPLAGEG